MNISHEYVIVLTGDNLMLPDTIYSNNKYTTVTDKIITCVISYAYVLHKSYGHVVYNNPYV